MQAPLVITGRQKRRVLALFVLATLVIPLQELVRRSVGEPFPALFMPSFSGVDDTGSAYTVERGVVVVRDAQGQTMNRPAIDLTSDAGVIPDSVMRLMAFRGLDADGSLTSTQARPPAQLKLLGQHAGRVRSDDAAVVDDPAVQSWLLKRTRSLFPGHDIQQVTIEWHREMIDRSNRRVLSDQIIKTVPVIPRRSSP